MAQDETIIELLKSIERHLLNITIHNANVRAMQTEMYNWEKEEREQRPQMGKVVQPQRSDPGELVPVNNPFEALSGIGMVLDPEQAKTMKKIGEMVVSGKMHVPSKEEFKEYLNVASKAISAMDKEQKNFDDSVIKRKPRWDYDKENTDNKDNKTSTSKEKTTVD